MRDKQCSGISADAILSAALSRPSWADFGASRSQGLEMMMDRFLITAAQSPHVREWWVWEYDLAKPRNTAAPDKRQHYAVKRLVGVFRDQRAAEQAAEAA